MNGSIGSKCSGEHPTCQRCLARGLDCVYATERRMRGPNKPKPLPPPLAGISQLPVAGGKKTRKRASTMPTATRSASQIWAHHQNRQPRQQQQKQSTSNQEQGIATASSPASSAGSGSLKYPLLSESEASPMTPHSSIDSRHPSGAFPPSPRVFMHDFSAAMRTDVGHVCEGNNYHDGAAATTGGVLTGAYGQDIFRDVRMSLDNTKTLF
jgi:Fungal Zn(2)-Cys(6) binuclear cluster domain